MVIHARNAVTSTEQDDDATERAFRNGHEVCEVKQQEESDHDKRLLDTHAGGKHDEGNEFRQEETVALLCGG